MRRSNRNVLSANFFKPGCHTHLISKPKYWLNTTLHYDEFFGITTMEILVQGIQDGEVFNNISFERCPD